MASLQDVIQLHAGLYNYSHESELESVILEAAPEVDRDDVNVAWMLYQDPNMVIFGPNDIAPLQEIADDKPEK